VGNWNALMPRQKYIKKGVIMPKKGEGIDSLVSYDIPVHKHMEGQKAELESLYRDMVELSPDGIVTVDTKGVIRTCNNAAIRILGYSRDELVGKHFAKLGALRLKDVPKYLKLFKDVLGGKVGEPIEIAIQRKDKTLFIADVRVNLLRVGGKTVLQAAVRDITERKQMESEIQGKNEQLDVQNEELQSANEELQATEEELRATNEELQSANDELRETQEKLIRSEKLAAIGQLASGVGHELRNPLGAIKNAVFYIRRRIGNTDLPATEPRVMEFLDIMDEEVNAANKVITDLLGFSRVAKPTVSPVSIAGVIEDALKHNPLPENIKLASVIDENLPMVMVDADQVRQVFINIVLNAIQAMTDGGRLDIQAKSEGEFVEVEFSDSGSGIPKSAIKKIFDPLFTTKAKGIGLGLSVCKSILERHGGDIRVESKVGRGSAFTVSLPTR
jgi:PAS domain S-box-containing protein